jgi:hypothetical protein
MDNARRPNSLEDHVLDFTAQQWCVRRQKLSTNTQLAQNLGMAGDDAVEFFEKFGKEFRVNLEDLETRWDRHFFPQGGGGPSLEAIAVICLCVTAGCLLRHYVGILPAWGWGIGLIILAIVIDKRWFLKDTMVPSTVVDLVDSVRSGRWSKSYTAGK